MKQDHNQHSILLEQEISCSAEIASRMIEAIVCALREEGVVFPCEVSVVLTGDEAMRQINLEQRGVDSSTDVLSFPMFQLTPGQELQKEDLDPETGLYPLGDLVISLERAQAQAQEYGHSLEREVCYLAVHSVLHLLGYDHLDEAAEKKRMRRREEEILTRLDLVREKTQCSSPNT